MLHPTVTYHCADILQGCCFLNIFFYPSNQGHMVSSFKVLIFWQCLGAMLRIRLCAKSLSMCDNIIEKQGVQCAGSRDVSG